MTTKQIEKDEAARAMLRALRRDQDVLLVLQEWFGARNQTHHGLSAALRQTTAAIALASAAGIKEE